MATVKSETGSLPTAAETNDESLDEKKGVSHDETRPSVSPPDVEEARPAVEHPPMTWKRVMAIFSLGCLLAAAQIPVYLIGGAVGSDLR
jgi:hypothetical protein